MKWFEIVEDWLDRFWLIYSRSCLILHRHSLRGWRWRKGDGVSRRAQGHDSTAWEILCSESGGGGSETTVYSLTSRYGYCPKRRGMVSICCRSSLTDHDMSRSWCASAKMTGCRPGLHKLWYPGIRDMSTWSKFGAHGEHGDVFLFSNLGALWFSENLIRYSLHICLREVKNNFFSFIHSYLRHSSWRF